MKINLTGNLKQCVAKRKKLNNKGVAMISALMMVVIFSIIGTSILSIAINQVTNSAKKEIAFTSKYALTQAAECVLDVIDNVTFTGENSADTVKSILRTEIDEVFKIQLIDSGENGIRTNGFSLIVNGENTANTENGKSAPSYSIQIKEFNCTVITDSLVTNQYNCSINFKVIDEHNEQLYVEAKLIVSFDDASFKPSEMQVLTMTYGE